MIKSVGTVVAGIALSITLIASWTHFYAEHKVNSMEIKTLKHDKRELTKVVYTINNNQSGLIEAVSNQATQTEELREDFKGLLNVLTQNQKYLADIIDRDRE